MAYFYLFLAVIFGTASNTFANSAQGFTKFLPSLLSAITIVLCMLCLSNVMKSFPVGITYAIFAGFTIIATVIIGIVRFNQLPNFYYGIFLFIFSCYIWCSFKYLC